MRFEPINGRASRDELRLTQDCRMQVEIGSDAERALFQVVNRMLATAVRGGVLEVRIETEGTTRRTQIRFRHDRSKK